jgi:spore germination protein
MNVVRTCQHALLSSVVLLTACGGGSSTSPTPTPTPSASPIPSPPPTSKVVLGYYVDYDVTSYTSVTSYFGYLNVVSAAVFTVRTDGGIAGTIPSGLVSFDAARGIGSYACVNNDAGSGFDPSLAQAAIVTNRTATIGSLIALARGSGFTGVNVDLENLWTGGDVRVDRSNFSAFIAELGPALHAQGLKLVISVPAKEEDSSGNTWAYPFDYAAIGAYADLIQLMTYDQHYSGSDPGPVAGRDWMERCVVFAKGKIPPAKLLIGLPAYGRDWDLDAAVVTRDFVWREVPTLLSLPGASVQYQASSDSPFVTYTDASSHRHEAWFENTQSIAAKTALVKKHGLAGISMWRLGQEDLSFWTATRVGLD